MQNSLSECLQFILITAVNVPKMSIEICALRRSGRTKSQVEFPREVQCRTHQCTSTLSYYGTDYSHILIGLASYDSKTYIIIIG